MSKFDVTDEWAKKYPVEATTRWRQEHNAFMISLDEFQKDRDQAVNSAKEALILFSHSWSFSSCCLSLY